MSNLNEKVSYLYDPRFYERMKNVQSLIDQVCEGDHPFDVINNIVNESKKEKVLSKFPSNTEIFPDGLLWSIWDKKLAQVNGPSFFDSSISDHDFDVDLIARKYQIRFAKDFDRKKDLDVRGLDVVGKEIVLQDSSIPWEKATFVIRVPGSFQDVLGKFGPLETFVVKVNLKDLSPAEIRAVTDNLRQKNYLDISLVKGSLPSSKWKKLLNMSFNHTQDLDAKQANIANDALNRFNKGQVFSNEIEDRIWSKFKGAYKLNKKGDKLLWIVKK
jgi:hypothetical protein